MVLFNIKLIDSVGQLDDLEFTAETLATAEQCFRCYVDELEKARGQDFLDFTRINLEDWLKSLRKHDYEGAEESLFFEFEAPANFYFSLCSYELVEEAEDIPQMIKECLYEEV